VTLLLKPAIVTGHLLGGLTTLALLGWLALRAKRVRRQDLAPRLTRGLRIGLLLLAVQIALGGWTSTNYAALACADFPSCHGSWWPAADYANAFHVLRELGMTAEGELLSMEALTAIHWAHRLGALVVGGYLALLALVLLRHRNTAGWGGLLLAGVVLQIGLGIANVLLALPLALAVAHNAVAAVLLLLMVAVNYRYRGARAPVWSGRKHANAYA
jgi:cytochrome c oxidase assembly protein subunit 15